MESREKNNKVETFCRSVKKMQMYRMDMQTLEVEGIVGKLGD